MRDKYLISEDCKYEMHINLITENRSDFCRYCNIRGKNIELKIINIKGTVKH